MGGRGPPCYVAAVETFVSPDNRSPKTTKQITMALITFYIGGAFEKAGYLATEHILQQGHSQVLMITRPPLFRRCQQPPAFGDTSGH